MSIISYFELSEDPVRCDVNPKKGFIGFSFSDPLLKTCLGYSIFVLSTAYATKLLADAFSD